MKYSPTSFRVNDRKLTVLRAKQLRGDQTRRKVLRKVPQANRRRKRLSEQIMQKRVVPKVTRPSIYGLLK
jgi:seryl-tRNA synthetase